MVDKNIVHKLAVERCRVHVSHLCALMHMSGGYEDDMNYVRHSLNGVFENLNRELALIEEIEVE